VPAALKVAVRFDQWITAEWTAKGVGKCLPQAVP